MTAFLSVCDWHKKRVSDKYDCDIDFQTFDMTTGLYFEKCYGCKTHLKAELR